MGCFVLVGNAQDGSNSSQAPDAAKAPVASSDKAPPGMNSNGEVIDASKVERGHGQEVKGINDFDGEITGVPAPRLSPLFLPVSESTEFGRSLPSFVASATAARMALRIAI